MQQSNDVNVEVENSHYFSTSSLKLFIMSICTFGLYELYWCYKNWVHIKEKKKLEIMPFWRAFFAPLWLYSLMTHLQDEINETKIPIVLHAGLLAALYFIMQLLLRLPDPYWLICYLSFVFLLPANTAILRLNENSATDVKPNDKIQGWNWLAVILGGLLFIIVLIGTFIPA
ncbi:MAG: hypothetical protein HN523_03610 [Porticoccaceae bacterium]|nr:hypothetical protein [Porticoccaceae bacterium]